MSDSKGKLDELTRRSEYQVNENRHYQRQAGLLIRVILATIGLTLTAGSLLVNVISVDFPKITLEALISYAVSMGESIGSSGAMESVGRIISVQIPVVFLILLGLSCYHLAVRIPRKAYAVLSPEPVEPGVSLSENGRLVVDQLQPESRVSEYQHNIGDNYDLIEASRRNLEACYNSIKMGILSLLMSIIVFVSYFVMGSSILVLLVYPLSLYVLFYEFQDMQGELPLIRDYTTLPFEALKFTCVGVLTVESVVAWFPITSSEALLGVSAALVLYIVAQSRDNLVNQLWLTLGQVMVALIVVMMLSAVLESNFIPYSGYIVSFVLFYSLLGVYAAILMWFGILGETIASKIGEKVEPMF